MTDPAFEGRSAQSPRPRRPRAFRLALALLGLVAVGAFVGVWVLPNVAGPIFLQVRALAAPRLSTTGPTISIEGGAPVHASALDVGVEVTNRYPLSVVVGTGAIAYKAAVYRHDAGGQVTRVWQSGVGDPALEEGSNSPAGGGSASGAAVVTAGTSRHDITGSATPFALTDSSGQPLPAGVYYLQVWAYGIGSGPVPISIDDGSDPLGPPSNLPAPADPTPAFQ